MKRRAKFADAAEAWFKQNRTRGPVDSETLWNGLKESHPELTTPSDTRKTPRATCMRDIREDDRFKVGGGKISLA